MGKLDAKNAKEFFGSTKEAILNRQQASQGTTLIDVVRSIHISDGVDFTLEGNFEVAVISAMAALSLGILSNISSLSTKINAKLKSNELFENDPASVK